MTDVFVKVWASSYLRAHMAGAVLHRLAMCPEARVHLVVSQSSLNLLGAFRRMPMVASEAFLAAERFWITSKQLADERAKSEVYVVIDDDHLPIGKDWLERGVAALTARPEFGMLASWSVNGEVPAAAGEDEVFESWAIGTPYFCRRGSLGTLPEGSLGYYDQTLSEHVKATAGRIGFLRHVRHNHLGFGYSQVIEGHWGA